MEKSPEAFRTISEVAEDMDLPQHVLRFWETRFPQIKPLKRGGGRRYYRPDDVELLRAIKELLYGEGYTIKGVQKLLREQGASGLVRSAARGARESAAEQAPPRGDEARERVRTDRRAFDAGRGFGGVARDPGRFARSGENSRAGARAVDRFAIA